MKILHIGIASSFTEGMSYQDNILPMINKQDGHDVIFVSNCNKYVNGKLVEVEEEDVIVSNGFRLIRLKYDKIVNKFISGKFRKISKLYDIIESFEPDVILFHGAAGYELVNVAKYKKIHCNTKFYVDSHEDKSNSGTNWVSLNVLHKIFYKHCIKKAIPYIDKVLYISEESKDFLIDVYGINEEKLEFYPLGGILFIEEERISNRTEKRRELGLNDDDILLVHSGKMDKLKRTEEIVNAFSSVKDERLKLCIIGEFSDDIKHNMLELIDKDKRIYYLGWKTSEELMKYLCASDMYVQPGGQSATMQNAICCGSPVALYPYKSHKPYVNGNGCYIESYDDMRKLFEELSLGKYDVEKMRKNSLNIADDILDYNKLAQRLYR